MKWLKYGYLNGLKLVKQQSSFKKNFISLLTGVVISQVFPLALMPLLSRLLTVEAFGEFSLYQSFVILLSVLATLRYEMAIVLPKEEYKAINLFKASLFISLFIALFLVLIFFIFQNLIIHQFNSKYIYIWIFFVPLSVFFNGIIQSSNYWSSRKAEFKIISISRIILSISANVLPLLFLKWIHTEISLIIFFIIGQFFTCGFLIVRYIKVIVFTKKTYSTENRIVKVLKEYKHFPYYNTASAFLDQLGSTIPLLFVNVFYNAHITGLYGMTIKIISIPASLISFSLSQVIYKELSEKIKTQQPLSPIIRRTFKGLCMIGGIPFLLLFVAGPFLFKIFLGNQWQEAGTIAQILSIGYFLKFCISPLSISLPVVHRLKALALWQVLYFLAGISIIIVNYCFPGFQLFCFMLLVADIVLYVYYYNLINKYTKSISF